MKEWIEFFRQSEWVREATGLVLVLLAALLANLLVQRILLRIAHRFVERSTATWDDALRERHVFERLASFVPIIVVYFGVVLIPDLTEMTHGLIQRVAMALLIVMGIVASNAFLRAANDIYSMKPVSRERPIKGYLQIVQIVIAILGSVCVIAILLDRSPWIFVSSIGALTAVLMLVFKDTILSLVASIQLSTNDMVAVGDWIEMPEYGADGDVIDIALHTVKVQNWDKTITTIPTHKLVESSFKNWRGMSESGGRRIKRSIMIDVNTIHFLGPEDIERFGRFVLLEKYIREKRVELEASNRHAAQRDLIANARRLTNVGTFRAYVVNYLHQHPKIHHQGMTFLVRQLAPTDKGLPIEIYVFATDTNWVNYEGIQADIFDHLLAIVPEFDLGVFQQPSGNDLRALARST